MSTDYEASAYRSPNYRYPALAAANRYLGGQYVRDSERSLARHGIFGQWLSGEILLDAASRPEDPYASPTSLLGSALSHFINAATPQPGGYSHRDVSTQARAQVRLAQFPAYKYMLNRSELPHREIALAMYTRLVKIGGSLVELSRKHRGDTSDSAIEVKGLIGEITPILLGQRYSLRTGIGCETWTILQSYFGEVNGSSCLNAVDEPSWHVNVFTQPIPDAPIDQTYRVYVKSSQYDAEMRHGVRSYEGITPLFVRPDLSSRPGIDEIGISEKVIAGCALELDQPANAFRVSRELDVRCNSLLAILG